MSPTSRLELYDNSPNQISVKQKYEFHRKNRFWSVLGCNFVFIFIYLWCVPDVIIEIATLFFYFMLSFATCL